MVHFKCGGLERAANQICKRFFWKATVLQIRKIFYLFIHIFSSIFLSHVFLSYVGNPHFYFIFLKFNCPLILHYSHWYFLHTITLQLSFLFIFGYFGHYACCGEYTIIKSGYNSVIYVTHIFGGNKIPLDSIHWVGLHIMK